MGGCVSSEMPAGASAAARPAPMGPAEKPHQQLDAPAQGSMPPVAITANGAGGAAHAAAAPVTLEADQQDVAKGFELLQQMSVLSGNPLMALTEAAQLMVEEGAADVVGVAVFPPGDESCAVLLAAHGEGALALERRVVMRGPEWSAIAALAAPGRWLSLPDTCDPDFALPADLAAVHDDCGIAAFEVAVVCPPHGAEPLGALIAGRRQAGGFVRGAGGRPPPQLAAASTGLLQLLRQSAVFEVARILAAVDAADDPVAAISTLLRGTAQYMLRATNLPMVVRLALIPQETGTVRLVMFELKPEAGGARRRSEAANGRGAAGADGGRGELSVTQMDVTHTLLRRAAAKQQALTIKDTTSYLQNCGVPPRDMFNHSAESCSVAVVPLMHHDDTLGALYFSPSDPNDFSNIQDTLVGFVAAVGPSLTTGLLASADLVNALVAEAKRASLDEADAQRPRSPAVVSASAGAAGPAGGGAVGGAMDMVPLASVDESDGTSGEDGVAAAGGPPAADVIAVGAADGAAAPGLSQLAVVTDRRLATEAMMKILQRDIRRGRRASMELSFMSDLTLVEAIGRGGYGTVYRGAYRSLPAAVKVMNARAHDGDAVSDAMEMAVLSSIGHANIVQLYTCLTDMVAASEEDLRLVSTSFAGAGAAGGAPAALPRFRRLLKGEGRDVPTFNVVVMEYCDCGTLRAAMKGGLFHSQAAPGAVIQVKLTSIVDVLLDVATALQYLHEVAGLVHGDIKADNVLLKSDPARPLGATAKLSDFGLAKVLSTEVDKHVINRTGAGTLTHLAPEMLRAGTTITTAIDTYAFGVMMWELYTTKRAFAGLTPDVIAQRVVHQGARPVFPPAAPPAYAELAASCWQAAPAKRPSFADIIRSLRQLRAALHAPAAPQQAPPAARPPAAVA